MDERDKYRWEIEDGSKLGLGYSAKLYRAGEPRAIAAREGFSTREGAVEWATSFQGGRVSLMEIITIGIGITAWVSALVSLVRLIRGDATQSVGSPDLVQHVNLGGGSSSSRSGAGAKPIIDVEGRGKP